MEGLSTAINTAQMICEKFDSRQLYDKKTHLVAQLSGARKLATQGYMYLVETVWACMGEGK